MRCVSCFYTNAQFFGILFFAVLLRLCRVDSTPTNMDASVAEDFRMNSFTLTAVGHMARNPEVVTKGDGACTRFCLIGNDYAGKDDEGMAREVTTSLWFSAFGAIGDAIAQHARKGDQLIVEARVRPNNWTDKQGEKQYDLTFIVQGFRFGAPGKVKREEFSGRREQTSGLSQAEEFGNAGASGEIDGREEAESDSPPAVPGYGVVGSSATEARSTMEVRESSSACGPVRAESRQAESHPVGPVSAPVAAKATQQAKAGQEAKSTQNKTRGSRSTRKTAASAA